MLIIVGLGNPGNKYEHSRHNVGYDVLEIISQKLNTPINKMKCKSLVAEARINGERVVLAKPQTFMNLSGQAVVELMNWYKAESHEVLIIYDDVDLDFAGIRFRVNGSAGTHNGMRNILELAPDNAFPRIRVGVGRPPKDFDLANWVLAGYNSKEDREKIFASYLLAADAAIEFAKTGSEGVRTYLSKQLANKDREEKDAK